MGRTWLQVGERRPFRHSLGSQLEAWALQPQRLPLPPTQRPHLELSGRDSACGIEVQRHHHGKPGGTTAVASGHGAKSPEDSEGGSNLFHCGDMRQGVTHGPDHAGPTSHRFAFGPRPWWVPCHLPTSALTHTISPLGWPCAARHCGTWIQPSLT